MIIASASIPVFFQPTTTIDGMQLVDGGTYSNLNLQAAIDRCREIVDDDANIIIDVLTCQEQTIEIPEYAPRSFFNVWNIHQQMGKIRDFYKAMSDILPVLDANPLVQLRNLIVPSEKLPGGLVPIVTDAKLLDIMHDIGYKDGLNAIDLEQDTNRSKALDSIRA